MSRGFPLQNGHASVFSPRSVPPQCRPGWGAAQPRVAVCCPHVPLEIRGPRATPSGTLQVQASTSLPLDRGSSEGLRPLSLSGPSQGPLSVPLLFSLPVWAGPRSLPMSLARRGATGATAPGPGVVPSAVGGKFCKCIYISTPFQERCSIWTWSTSDVTKGLDRRRLRPRVPVRPPELPQRWQCLVSPPSVQWA